MTSTWWQMTTVALLASLCTGCPDASSSDRVASDGGDVPSRLDGPRDLGNDLPTPDAASDLGALDAPVLECVPGRSVACACVDGRMGAQLCLGTRVWGPCVCVVADAGSVDTAAGPDAVLPSDVVLAPLGPRLLAPQSVSRVTSRRPTLRWVLPEGVTHARVEVCADRACTHVLVDRELEGTSWRPSSLLEPGVAWWHVQGLADDGTIAWTSATWEFVVGARDAPTDTSFGTVKDFNGDGLDDLVVPAEYADDISQHVHIYNGRRGGGSTSATSQQFVASPSGARTNYMRFGVGDFNGDGYADLATSIKPIAIAADYIYLRDGGPDGLTSDPTRYITEHEIPGYSLNQVAAGDFDGDGFSDLAVVANPLPRNGVGPDGRIYFFSGTSEGLSPTPFGIVEIPAGTFLPGIPFSFVPVGDVNGDGYADVLAGGGTPHWQGGAWLLAGHPLEPLQRWIGLAPPTSRHHFGPVASGIGDVNGDGLSDFALRSDEEVSVYLGIRGAFPVLPVRSIQSPEAPCELPIWGFGATLGAAGDFDGDGRADLVVGGECLPMTEFGRHGPGMVFVYPGQGSGVSDTPQIFRGMDPQTSFGAAAGGIGDFNGDGYGDLVIGQIFPWSDTAYVPVRVWIHRGSSAGADANAFWEFRLGGNATGRIFPTIAFDLRRLVAFTSRS